MIRSALLLFACLVASAAAADPRFAIAMHGEPALPPDFAHFPYVDPDAPKGGRIDYGVQGSFDSVNPFIVQGSAAIALADTLYGNNVFETLMQRSYDEPFTLYPLLAESIDTDDARTYAEFTLDPRAKFSDGEPVTPEDVIFSLDILKGNPRYARTVKKLARTEKVGTRGIRMTFAAPDRELPLILGLFPVLPKHAIDAARFEKSTLKPMIGSGPYVMAEISPGERIVLRRDPDYWGRGKPSKVGFDNFDEIRVSYFRDDNTLFEAFKKGDVDILLEANAVRWKTAYDFPALRDGRVVRDSFATGLPAPMLGFVMNTRRPIFADRATRAALAALFDFEWVNRNLFAGAYSRTSSFYQGSELSSSGRPASDAERTLLAPFPGAVTPEAMQGNWAPPPSDGSGRDRAFLKHGFEALKAAGFSLKDGRLIDGAGRPLSFEIMLRSGIGQDVASAWQRTLARLGIEVTLRPVDDAQYQLRLRQYDYDVVMQTYTASLSPGVEQVGRWGSTARDPKGTLNYAGAAEPAIDALIDAMLKATRRDDFVTAVRAYDRLLISGAYLVPLYHQPERWVGRWTRIGRPERTPLYGPQFTAWWRND